jgi:cytochrome b561
LSTPASSYTRIAVGLHWAIAILIFAAFPLGLYMQDLVLSPTKLRLINYHKWIGITVLMLVMVRLVWRSIYRPPELPATMAPWERSAALAVHLLLYALMVAAPLSGWLMSSATGFQTVWFGVIPLPDLIGKDKEFGRFLLELHRNLDYLLIALVGLHIAAALKHHFIARDDILSQMIPFLRKRGSSGAAKTEVEHRPDFGALPNGESCNETTQ